MTDLEDRLARLGDVLLVDDDAGLVDDVLARLDEPTDGRRMWLRAAAVLVLVVVAVVVAVPSSRRTVADWFGLDGVRVERRPDLVVDDTVPSLSSAPAPGESEVVTIDGEPVVVSTIDGTLDAGFLTKVVGASTSVIEVDVSGAPGLWIAGRPHELLYVGPDGEGLVERMAANTLLWQEGTLIWRIEGIDDLDAALAFAQDLGT